MEMTSVPKYFGELVFDDRVMKSMLSDKTYLSLKKTIDEGANLELSVEDIQKELNKRKPGTSSVTTPRKEDDEVQILSGIFEGKTDGTPITGVVFNKNQKSKDLILCSQI